MNNFFRLNLYLTIKSPDGKDVRMSASRTLPFQPIDGLVLLLPLCDGSEEDGMDPEYPVTLGPPTYSYLESAFVESQEDDSVLDLVRAGDPPNAAMAQIVNHYTAYGFKKEK